ncbi:Integral membrane HRF1 family protein [Euphorbia peplus]|nr:Integral membrane HRF1 family protein [Euphorbia peplus]
MEGNSLEKIMYGATSHLITNELCSYGDELLGSSSAYLHLNISRYLSKIQYYFQVNDEYVKKKLRIILFPFLYKGHWMRIRSERIEDEVWYYYFKAPMNDINAPDLYIPFMAFPTYLLLSAFFLGINCKFSPEALSVQLTNGLLCWLFQVLLLEATLHTLGDGDVPLLDLVAYSGYTFVASSVSVVAKICCIYCFHLVTLWESFCMGMLFVKIIKRILIAEMSYFENHSTRRHYLLLLVASLQIPLLFWLGNISI